MKNINISQIINISDKKLTKNHIKYLMSGDFDKYEYLFLNNIQGLIQKKMDLNNYKNRQKINQIIDILLSNEVLSLSKYYDSLYDIVSLKNGHTKTLNLMFITYIHVGLKAIERTKL